MINKKFKIISVVKILLLINGMLIMHYSEFVRIHTPLYPILKMLGWGMFFISIIWSGVNSILIYDTIKNNLKKHLIWILMSLIPLMHFFYILVLVSLKMYNKILDFDEILHSV